MPLAVGSTLQVAQRTWPDRPHWSYPVTVLGTDDQGTWAAVPSGTPARRGDGPVRSLSAFVVLVPPTDPWLVECYLDHPEIAVYVNVGTVPEVDGRDITQIDLDLDVVLRRDGSVEVEDRDEFASNRSRYPADLVELAESAATRAAARLQATSDPFGARRWLQELADLERR